MGDDTDSTLAYQKARADFDARWQAALSPPEPGEIKVGETLAQDALLDRMLTRIRELAAACADRGLIEPQGRDAVHAALDAIDGAFAGVAREALAELMRSPVPAQAPGTPPSP